MEPLFRLLRELIELAAPQGNKRGELHALVDALGELYALAAPSGEAPAGPDGPAGT